MKTRIEFDTYQEAADHQKETGGWRVRHENKKGYWYCMNWTPTQILNDMPGNYTINPSA